MRTSRNVDMLPPHYRGQEQTFIKHLILRRYLETVARHILWSQPDFVFVDGFSGPWASTSVNYQDTSFGIAMTLLRRVRDELKATHHKERRVRCVFVERGARAFARLSEAVRAASYIEAHAIHGRFEDHVDEILRTIGRAFALVSIDPKGWSFDLRKLAPLLRHRPGEVIVNFMFEHINRFLDDERQEIRASYVLPFGDRNWRSRFDALQSSGLGREEAVLELFREQLKSVGEYTYVISARVQRPTSSRSQFYLVYGTRNRKDLTEFRNVEKKAMEAEELSRIEAQREQRAARTGQGSLAIEMPRPVVALRTPEIERAANWLRRELMGVNWITYTNASNGALERFSLTESEFKDLIVDLQKRGEVNLTGMAARQRKPSEGTTIHRTANRSS
jgi:three-Cys-motif partner protein